MRANTWAGRNKVEVRDVPDPRILNSRDAIVRITSTAICGSDLHLVDGYVPTMQDGDVMGHEFMGEVVEVGPGVDAGRLRIGDRVVVPFPIACGACAPAPPSCTPAARTPTPTPGIAEKMFGHPVAGIFGYSHLTGGFAGGQARVRAGAVRRRRPAEDRVGPDRRAGAVPLRHPAHRLHGRRDVRHPAHATWWRCGAPARSGSSPWTAPGCSAPRRSSPSTRSRTGCRWREQAGYTPVNFEEESTCGPGCWS